MIIGQFCFYILTILNENVVSLSFPQRLQLHPDPLTHCLIAGSRVFWVRQEKRSLHVYAENEGADQPAHPRSLIRTFAFGLQKYSLRKHAYSNI